jgi:hypothetical protein
MLSLHLAVAVALCLSVLPAWAQNNQPESFVALTDIAPADQEAMLEPLSDSQLDSIHGAGVCFGCPSINVYIAVAPITQVNVITQLAFAVGQDITQIQGVSAVNQISGSRGGR